MVGKSHKAMFYSQRCIYKRFSFVFVFNFKPYIFSLMAAPHLKVGTGETKGFF